MWLDGKWEMNFLGKGPKTVGYKDTAVSMLYKVQSHFTLCKLQVKTFKLLYLSLPSILLSLLVNENINSFQYFHCYLLLRIIFLLHTNNYSS